MSCVRRQTPTEASSRPSPAVTALVPAVRRVHGSLQLVAADVYSVLDQVDKALGFRPYSRRGSPVLYSTFSDERILARSLPGWQMAR